MTPAWRARVRPPRFDPAAAYVVRRKMLFNGRLLKAGEPFDASMAEPRRFKWLYETRRIVVGDAPSLKEPPPDELPVGEAHLKHLGFGHWTVERDGERLIEPTTKPEAEAFLASL